MNKSVIRYVFHCNACGKDDDLHVLLVKGMERLGQPYEFSLLLAGKELDPESLLDAEAALSIHCNNRVQRFCGWISGVDEKEMVHGWYRYRVTLSPVLAKLGLSATSAMYVETSVPDIIKQMLQDSRMFQHLDAEQKLSGDYPKLALVTRHQENDLQFLQRLLERSGIYYFFEQGSSEQTPDRVVFADAPVAHNSPGEEQTFAYREADGMVEDGQDKAVRNFSVSLGLAPGQVEVDGYNSAHPEAQVFAKEQVQAHAASDKTKERFWNGADNSKQAQAQATVRAQALSCHANCFNGALDGPGLRPGMVIKLKEHPQDSLNAEYLVTGVRHEGTQPLPNGNGKADSCTYHAEFSAIPSKQHFKMLWKTPKPLISGVLNARINAEGSGQYAEVDADGYYKVLLPFGPDEKSTPVKAKIRMLQPYGGNECGLHLPLHKDCEVLVAFLQGDPDRPVIVGAVPNAGSPSVITSATPGVHCIKTASGHVFAMDDSNGNNTINLTTGNNKTTMQLGDFTYDKSVPKEFKSVIKELGEALSKMI